MVKIIERNVFITEETEALSGTPATDMFEEWSEELAEKADIPAPHQDTCNKPQNELEREKRLMEMDEVVKEDIENMKH